MKNSKLFALVALVSISMSITANAALIHSDWEVDGDQRATLHEETGIEWLKLDNTIGLSANDALGQFSGWRIASGSEVTMFMNAAYTGLGFTNRAKAGYNRGYGSKSLNYGNLMGFTAPGVSSRSAGLFIENDNLRTSTIIYSSRYLSHNSYNHFAGSFATGEAANTTGLAGVGVFLVSDGGVTLSSRLNPSLNSNNENAPINATQVNAPASLGFLAVGMLGLMFVRKRKSEKLTS